MAPIGTKSLGLCHLLRLPLELRDLIYRMLLTTPYCTHLSTMRGYEVGPVFEFHLHPAILLVNKQISEEAIRVLYQENDFILIKTSLKLDLDQVPTFKRLSDRERRVPPYLLRIEMSDIDCSCVDEFTNGQCLFTTPEGLQSIICSIWKLDFGNSWHQRFHHRDLWLSLEVNLKAGKRYEALSDLVLKPWEKVNGFKKLELWGDIREPMRQRLEKAILNGPLPSEVAARLKEYNSLAEREFQQENYDAARLWWHLLATYWAYLFNLRAYPLIRKNQSLEGGDFLKDVLRKSLPMYFEGKLKLIKACIHQSKFQEVAGHASEANSKCLLMQARFGYHFYDLKPIMSNKFTMALSFSQDAPRKEKLDIDTLEGFKRYILEEPEE
jgi:hypothetical protein